MYSEDPENLGTLNSNLGMYRIQLSGNDYVQNKEIGVHYQIHRGIGVHQKESNKMREALKVSIFIGGPPAHIFSAVMPLPEDVSELTFAGVLGGRRFRYAKKDGYISLMDTLRLGMVVVYLGGGSLQRGDTLDPSVGIVFHKKLGDKVCKGEPLLEYYCSGKDKFESGKLYFNEVIQIQSQPPELRKLIYR